MVDSAVPESSMTPEQRVDAVIASSRFGEIGLGSLGVGEYLDSGGGGGGGQFVFASLADLDAVLTRWTELRDRIQQRGQKTEFALRLCNPPAEDMMSWYQADAASKTLGEKVQHDKAMLAYADAYVQKLTDARNGMAATEQANADQLRNLGGDLDYA